MKIKNDISTATSLCPSVRLYVRPSVTVTCNQKLGYFRVFSIFNVILCCPPGGARQYPRSGYFLVDNIPMHFIHPKRTTYCVTSSKKFGPARNGTRPDTGHKLFAVFVSARQKKRLRTDRRTDGRTDTPSYRVVCSRLKTGCLNYIHKFRPKEMV